MLPQGGVPYLSFLESFNGKLSKRDICKEINDDKE